MACPNSSNQTEPPTFDEVHNALDQLIRLIAQSVVEELKLQQQQETPKKLNFCPKRCHDK